MLARDKVSEKLIMEFASRQNSGKFIVSHSKKLFGESASVNANSGLKIHTTDNSLRCRLQNEFTIRHRRQKNKQTFELDRGMRPITQESGDLPRELTRWPLLPVHHHHTRKDRRQNDNKKKTVLKFPGGNSVAASSTLQERGHPSDCRQLVGKLSLQKVGTKLTKSGIRWSPIGPEVPQLMAMILEEDAMA
ncbi:hypothetical protein R1sor_021339 [Riccia sorocarpa]|uniref:Uncharacterized protein n=1 Tax=Riccia sorocarpa TaxID=122646 RepID=A0ABD3GHJ7_9MARC